MATSFSLIHIFLGLGTFVFIMAAIYLCLRFSSWIAKKTAGKGKK